MRTFFRSVEQEFKRIFRNGISIFMVAAPAILAFVFLLVFGAMNQTAITLATDNTLGAAQMERLSRVAALELFDNTAVLEARVRKADAVAGVTMRDGEVTVLFEGNEGQSVRDAVRKVVGLALNAPEEGVAYRSETVEAKGKMTYTLSMISMLLIALFIGGATIGLSIVDERESGAIRAVAVSPLRLSEYVAAKLAPGLLLALASALVSGMMTFAIGSFANNQIAAIGVLKILVPLGMILPVSAMFVPQQWQFLNYPLPMYWQYRALSVTLAGEPLFWPVLLTLLVSVPWFLAAVWHFANRTKFKMER